MISAILRKKRKREERILRSEKVHSLVMRAKGCGKTWILLLFLFSYLLSIVSLYLVTSYFLFLFLLLILFFPLSFSCILSRLSSKQRKLLGELWNFSAASSCQIASREKHLMKVLVITGSNLLFCFKKMNHSNLAGKEYKRKPNH